MAQTPTNGQTVSTTGIDPYWNEQLRKIWQQYSTAINDPKMYGNYPVWKDENGKPYALVAGEDPYETQAYAGIAGLREPDEYGRASSVYDEASRYNPTLFGDAEQIGTPASFREFGDAAQIATPAAFGPYSQLDPFQTRRFQQGEQFGQYKGPQDVGQSGEFGAAQAQQYMSPYMQGVTNIAIRNAREEEARQRAQAGLSAARSGGYGGGRMAVADAMRAMGLNRAVGDITAEQQQKAFENAQQQYERDRQARLQYGQANIDAAQRAYALNQTTAAQNETARRAGFESDIGAQERAYGLNVGAKERAYALNQATDAANAQRELEYYNANRAAREAAYGLNKSTYDMNTRNALDFFRENRAAREAAYGLNQGAREFAEQQRLNAAAGLGALGTSRQSGNLARFAALQGAGIARREQRGREIASGLEEFRNAKMWDLNNMLNAANLLQGYPMGSSTLTTGAGQQPSGASQFWGNAGNVASNVARWNSGWGSP